MKKRASFLLAAVVVAVLAMSQLNGRHSVEPVADAFGSLAQGLDRAAEGIACEVPGPVGTIGAAFFSHRPRDRAAILAARGQMCRPGVATNPIEIGPILGQRVDDPVEVLRKSRHRNSVIDAQSRTPYPARTRCTTGAHDCDI